MRRITHGLAFLAALALPAPAGAGGIPVIDATAIAKMAIEYSELVAQGAKMTEQIGLENTQIGQLAEQIAQGTERAAQLAQQIEQLDTQIAAMTGGRDLAGLIDGDVRDELMALMPGEIASIIDGGGAPQVQARFQAMLEEFAPLSPEELRPMDPGATSVLARRDATERVYAAIALAEEALAQGEDVAAQYGELIAGIDATEDVKASMDLAARIAAENGLMMDRLTRLLATQMQAVGAVERRDIAITEEPMEYRPDLASGIFAGTHRGDGGDE